MNYFSGIGSRSTPGDIRELMTDTAKVFTAKGWILRSGGALGADRAFEQGVLPGAKEIYIAWGFLKEDYYYVPKEVYIEAEKIAASVHPAWDRCSDAVKKLHTRNVCIILGKDLQTPSKMVIYWAPEVDGVVQGGTATAVNLARSIDIPTHNLLYKNNRDNVSAMINKYKGKI